MIADSESHPNLRKIAIVLSSLDAESAQQLILQLPTEMASQVRAYSCALDDVSTCERAEVIQEFEAFFSTDEGPANDCQQPTGPKAGESQLTSLTQNSWDALPAEVVAKMVSGESPLLIAALVAELDAYNASDLLSQLPAHRSCEVLRALKHLHEIDSTQRSQIEDRLALKFSEAEIRSKRGQQYDRQLSALVEAAPEELQQVWRTAIDKEETGVGSNWPNADQPSNVFSAFDTSGSNDIPIVQLPNAAAFNSKDASWLQGLEDLFKLPRQSLEELFASLSPETVLLSLAGASPEFMQEFYAMLEPEDAAELRKRLHKLSGVRLTEIDEAQTIVLSEAARLAAHHELLEVAP